MLKSIVYCENAFHILSLASSFSLSLHSNKNHVTNKRIWIEIASIVRIYVSHSKHQIGAISLCFNKHHSLIRHKCRFFFDKEERGEIVVIFNKNHRFFSIPVPNNRIEFVKWLGHHSKYQANNKNSIQFNSIRIHLWFVPTSRRTI